MTLSHLFSFVPQPSIILRWVFHLSNLFFFVGLNVVNTFLMSYHRIDGFQHIQVTAELSPHLLLANHLKSCTRCDTTHTRLLSSTIGQTLHLMSISIERGSPLRKMTSKISLAVVIILLIADDTDHPTVRLGTDIQIPVQSLRRRWTKQTWVYRYIGDTLG